MGLLCGTKPKRVSVLYLFTLIAATVSGASQGQIEFAPPTVLNSNADSDSGSDDWPQVATDGAGNWLVVWHSSDTLENTIGADLDILISRSTDNGVTWTAPVALNTNAASDSGGDYCPKLATDRRGNYVVVWYSTDTLGNTIGSDPDIFVARSSDNGVTWTPPIVLNTNAASDSGGDDLVQVTTDMAGTWIAVWSSQDTLGNTIGDDYDIFVARSMDNGATWTPSTVLNTSAYSDTGDDILSHIATDGAGNWIVVWFYCDGQGTPMLTNTEVFVARSTDNGTTWSPPASLYTSDDSGLFDCRFPQVETDRLGHWLIVWESREDLGGTTGTDRDLFVARSTDIGVTWTSPMLLNANGGSDLGDRHGPSVATDAAGDWIAVWASSDDMGGTVGTDYDIVMAQSTDDGATWTAPLPLNTNAATDSGLDWCPHVATDNAGNWLVVWEIYGNLGSAIGNDRDILIAAGVTTQVNSLPALSALGLGMLAMALLALMWRFHRYVSFHEAKGVLLAMLRRSGPVKHKSAPSAKSADDSGPVSPRA